MTLTVNKIVTRTHCSALEQKIENRFIFLLDKTLTKTGAKLQDLKL